MAVNHTVISRADVSVFHSMSHLPCSFICRDIMEYSSTPHVGMAPGKNGIPNKCVQNDMFITLV